jgi:hypothetical protein
MTAYFVNIIHTDEFDQSINKSMYRPKLCFSHKDVINYIKQMLIEYISIQILMNFDENDEEYHDNEYIKIIEDDKSIDELTNSRDHFTQGILGNPLFDWVINSYHDEEFNQLNTSVE